jgi:hypothetical protein
MINTHTHILYMVNLGHLSYDNDQNIIVVNSLFIYYFFNSKEELKINKVEDFKHDEINCNYV